MPNAWKRPCRHAGNSDVTVSIYPKANHLFQEAVTGSPDEYAALDKEYLPGFLDEITAWILERVENTR